MSNPSAPLTRLPTQTEFLDAQNVARIIKPENRYVNTCLFNIPESVHRSNVLCALRFSVPEQVFAPTSFQFTKASVTSAHTVLVHSVIEAPSYHIKRAFTRKEGHFHNSAQFVGFIWSIRKKRYKVIWARCTTTPHSIAIVLKLCRQNGNRKRSCSNVNIVPLRFLNRKTCIVTWAKVIVMELFLKRKRNCIIKFLVNHANLYSMFN